LLHHLAAAALLLQDVPRLLHGPLAFGFRKWPAPRGSEADESVSEGTKRLESLSRPARSSTTAVVELTSGDDSLTGSPHSFSNRVVRLKTSPDGFRTSIVTLRVSVVAFSTSLVAF